MSLHTASASRSHQGGIGWGLSQPTDAFAESATAVRWNHPSRSAADRGYVSHVPGQLERIGLSSTEGPRCLLEQRGDDMGNARALHRRFERATWWMLDAGSEPSPAVGVLSRADVIVRTAMSRDARSPSAVDTAFAARRGFRARRANGRPATGWTRKVAATRRDSRPSRPGSSGASRGR